MRHLKLNKLYVATCAALMGVSLHTLAWANDDANLNTVEPILSDTVVVTASRTQQELLDVNSSMSVVSATKAVTQGIDNIPDMLKKEPGIHLVSDGTPGAKRIALRGENASRTLIMVNGQRIDDQKTKSGAPLLINPYFAERIEVVKGPASVLYGSDAMGGVVNIINKKSSNEPFAADAGLNFTSASNGFTEYGNIYGTLNGFHYAIGGFNTNQGDIYLSDRDRLENTSYNAHGLNADLSYDFTDHLNIGVNSEYYNVDAKTATTTSDSIYGEFEGEIPKWERQKHSLYFSATDLNDYIAAIDGSLYYQTNNKDFNSKPVPIVDVSVANEQRTIGGDIKFELSLSDRFYLITGYEYRQEDVDSISDIKVKPANLNVHLDDADYKQKNHAIYALLSTYLTDELTLNTGLRYNYIKTMTGQSSMSVKMSGGKPPMGGRAPLAGGKPPAGMPNIPAINQDLSDSVNVRTVGSAGLVYRPLALNNAAFRLNWSQGFRVPNIQELFLTTSTGALQTGNPDLKPETSNNYELGFRWEEQNGLVADLALFYTQSKDYIETYEFSNNAFTYRNIAKAKTYGAELAVSYLINNTYEPYINLTTLRREYETEKGSSKNTGTPLFSGNVGLRYYHDIYSFDGWAQFASETKNDNFDGASYFDDVTYGGYVTLNMSLSAKLPISSFADFTVYGSLENILDKNYQTTELIHEPGRFVTLGIRGDF